MQQHSPRNAARRPLGKGGAPDDHQQETTNTTTVHKYTIAEVVP